MTHPVRFAASVALAMAHLVGCSSGSDPSGSDRAAPPDAASVAASEGLADSGPRTFNQAPHDPLPRSLSLGGPVLTAPHVIPIFFPDDPLQAEIERFLAQLAGSSYWSATTAEYGAGALSVGAAIVVSSAAPAATTRPDIESWLKSHLDGSDPEWPAVDGNNVYVVFYPQDTSIASEDRISCVGFDGYHGENVPGRRADESIEAGSGEVDGGGPLPDAGEEVDGGGPRPDAGGISLIYAVLPRCQRAGLSALDSLTLAVSHELVEAATDPFVHTKPAFVSLDADNGAWNLFSLVGGGEVADLCGSEHINRLAQRVVGDFMVQRTWSNRSARADGDPCVPASDEVYFNGSPEFTEVVTVVLSPMRAFRTTGITIPIGESRTVNVHLFATAPTADWSEYAREIAPAVGSPSTLQFSWDRSTGNNGDTLRLTIHRTANGSLGGSPIVLFSAKVGNPLGQWDTLWPAFIAN